jgi:hypothetical protein
MRAGEPVGRRESADLALVIFSGGRHLTFFVVLQSRRKEMARKGPHVELKSGGASAFVLPSQRYGATGAYEKEDEQISSRPVSFPVRKNGKWRRKFQS